MKIYLHYLRVIYVITLRLMATSQLSKRVQFALSRLKHRALDVIIPLIVLELSCWQVDVDQLMSNMYVLHMAYREGKKLFDELLEEDEQ